MELIPTYFIIYTDSYSFPIDRQWTRTWTSMGLWFKLWLR